MQPSNIPHAPTSSRARRMMTLILRARKLLETPKNGKSVEGSREVWRSPHILHYGGRHKRSPGFLEKSRRLLYILVRASFGQGTKQVSIQALVKAFLSNKLPFFKELPTKLLKLLSRDQHGGKASQGGASHGGHPGRGGLDRARHGEGIRGSKGTDPRPSRGVLGSQVQPVSHEEFMSFQDKVMTMFASVESRMEALAARMDARDQEIRQELAIYKTAVSARVMATHEAPRVEVPKPHTFSGKRDAKELDNFLWHMERYFEALHWDEATKVRTATLTSLIMLLYGGVDDVAYLARKSLKRLKHTGSIREYVKEFSTLMLEIPNMAEEELLFNFMDNLQSWAEQELRRRGVQDLATAMAVAESLVDYRRGDSSKPKPPSKGNQAKGGGDKRSQGHTSKEGSSKGPSGKDGKGKDKRRSSRPGPIASCAMVRTGHGTALRGRL
ncbi:hypothetical protein CK203_080192 [Vitis vinifera]|uniref:Uncharacterized protein n=1 Tax=Vitis vinifera TaxID=29760 RepID=A0A438F2M0_VITVI|nr:hypothetical protein CK203_080192 [Vitis vinifera]